MNDLFFLLHNCLFYNQISYLPHSSLVTLHRLKELKDKDVKLNMSRHANAHLFYSRRKTAALYSLHKPTFIIQNNSVKNPYYHACLHLHWNIKKKEKPPTKILTIVVQTCIYIPSNKHLFYSCNKKHYIAIHLSKLIPCKQIYRTTLLIQYNSDDNTATLHQQLLYKIQIYINFFGGLKSITSKQNNQNGICTATKNKQKRRRRVVSRTFFFSIQFSWSTVWIFITVKF